ncbi:MAG: heme-binding domain-containing protein, partial [Acidobacteria bacterium]|nr:heme-binding domain-containing protein [Acidobacteriota bacterium]
FKEVCEQVGSGEMPMTAYVIGHPNAALTEADKKALCDWANSLRRDDGSDH